MQRSRSFFSRKPLLFVGLFFVGILALFFVFRSTLMVEGTKWCLRQALPKTLTYQDVVAVDGKIVIKGMNFFDERYQMTLERVEFALSWQTVLKAFPALARQAKEKKEVAHWVQSLHLMKQYGMNLDVDNGVLQLDKERYYFSFKNGKTPLEIGTLSVFHDPGLIQHPFFLAHFQVRDKQLVVQMKVEEVPSDRALHLAAFAFPELLGGCKDASGFVQMGANVAFEQSGELVELSTHIVLENFELFHPETKLSLQMKNLIVDLNYPEGAKEEALPLWKQTLGSLFLEGGSCSVGKDFALSQLEGNLVLDPRENPTLTLKGLLASPEKSLALQLEGKGALCENEAYWLEFGLKLNDRAGTEADAFLSICQTEKESLVVQLEAKNLFPQQVEMVKSSFSYSLPRLKEWQVKQGQFSGKLVALFEKKQLAHFEIQDLLAEQVVLQPQGEKEVVYLDRLQGEGRFVQWQPQLMGELNLKIDLPLTHLMHFASPLVKGAYDAYRPDDQISLNTTMKFQEKGVETLASLEWVELKQLLHLGFKSSQAFPSSLQEIQEGWARSEKLTHKFYGSMLGIFSEDLEIYGDVDLVATYSGKALEFDLQVDDFLVKHPLLDVKASKLGEKGKTQGRAKIHFDPVALQWEGHVPLRGAMAFDHQLGLFFKDLDADLLLNFHQEERSINGNVTKTDILFDGKPIVKNAQFDFALQDKEILFCNAIGQLALPTDKEFFLAAEKIRFADSDSSCLLRLLDGKKELACFEGNKKEGWQGNLLLDSSLPLGGGLQVQLDWDPILLGFTLDATGKEMNWLGNICDHFHLRLKKQDTEFLIEKLALGNLSAKGSFKSEKEGFSLQNIEVCLPHLVMKGSGSFFIDLPQTTQSFSLRSDLLVETEITSPFPLHIKGSSPLKLAFSPAMGLILSDLHLTAAGSHCHIDHVEKFFAQPKTFLHKCRFLFAEPLVTSLIQAKLLPEFLSDIRFCKKISGDINLGIDADDYTITGRLHQAALWQEEENQDLEVEVKLGAKKQEVRPCLLMLREVGKKEGMAIELQWGPEGASFQSVKGSMGHLTADLKKQAKEALKGVIKCDFSLFGELFDLPINRYLHLWKAGSGYQFEGNVKPEKRLCDWTFSGKVKGQGFECAGYKLRSLEAKIEIQPGQISIENLDITDDAGKLWIGEGALMRSRNQGGWIFSFPLVEIRGFQPSFLHHLGREEKSSHPLIIKSASITNLRGKIDDPKSITGQGNFRFTNKGKTVEARLPHQALKNLGLDGVLLIPTVGEMEYSIREGKCHIQKLRAVYSEKNRSEFLLPKNGAGYFDFSGNLFLDLQVKPEAAATAVPLQLRGSWELPELSLK